MRPGYEANIPAALYTMVLLVILGVTVAFRMILLVNLPLEFLHTAGHDDGLYMRLATNIAAGRWLGPFDQFTLMKGPGYPAFLAVAGLSGLPVSAAHALLQIAAIAVTAWAVLRLTGSRAIAAVTFVLLALHPIGFVPQVQGVIRDQIYWAQTLLAVSLFAIILYAPPRGRAAAIVASGLAGLILGWAWLTREEGVWFLPGLALLAAGAVLLNRKAKGELLALARNACVAAAGFVVVNAAFMTANRIAYGSFIGVDFKERNFASALDGLQHVDVGPIVPHLSVPLAARAAVAEVSPTFAPLNAALMPGAPLWGWHTPGCAAYEHTCDDIATGWFMWALRDAAAASNFYESPATASAQFGKIADDIAAACADGRLKCRRHWLSYVPPVTYEQWGALPAAIAAIGAGVTFLDPPAMASGSPSPVNVRPEEFQRYWAFLNYPLITGADEPGPLTTLRGWYRDTASTQWPEFAVYAENEEPLEVAVSRRASPDLPAFFSDDRLSRNRFEISYRCPNKCAVAAYAPDGDELRLPISSTQPDSVASNGITLYVDSISVKKASDVVPEQQLAAAVRTRFVALYRVILPLLVFAGLAAFAAACAGAIVNRALRPVLAVAAAAWVLAATRILLLALLDVSAFPGANILYSAPASYLAVVASMLSMAAALPRRFTVPKLRFKLPDSVTRRGVSSQSSSRVVGHPLAVRAASGRVFP